MSGSMIGRKRSTSTWHECVGSVTYPDGKRKAGGRVRWGSLTECPVCHEIRPDLRPLPRSGLPLRKR